MSCPVLAQGWSATKAVLVICSFTVAVCVVYRMQPAYHLQTALRASHASAVVRPLARLQPLPALAPPVVLPWRARPQPPRAQAHAPGPVQVDLSPGAAALPIASRLAVAVPLLLSISAVFLALRKPRAALPLGCNAGGQAHGHPKPCDTHCVAMMAVAGAASDGQVLEQVCARELSAIPEDMLRRLESDRLTCPPPQDQVEGVWELVFSTFVQGVPLINGYLPVQEYITVSFAERAMSLETTLIRALPRDWQPKFKIYPGDVFLWDAQTAELTFNLRVRPDAAPKEVKSWQVLYADSAHLLVRSGTGYNLMKRVPSAEE